MAKRSGRANEMNGFMQFLFDRMFIVDMLIITLLSGIRLEKRKLFAVRATLGAAGCLFLGWALPQIYNLLNVDVTGIGIGWGLEFFIMLGFIALCYRLSVWKVFFVGTNCYFIQHTAFCIDRIIRGELVISVGIYFQHYLFIIAVGVVVWFAYWRKVSSETLDKLYWVQTLIVAFIAMFVCGFLHSYVTYIGEDNRTFRIADLMCNIVSMCCQYTMLYASILSREKQKVQDILDESVNQYRVAKQNMDIINIKCHDLKHQIRAFQKRGEIDDKAFAEMEHVIDLYDCSLRTENAALDVILTEKSLLCKNKNIEFTCMADGSSLPPMDAGDIYALFGNAIDNAIEAVEKLPDDCEKRIIGLTISRADKLCNISLHNYTADVVVFKDGFPSTTKADKNEHGFGVKSMAMLTHKYGGELSFAQEDDVFYTNIVLPSDK